MVHLDLINVVTQRRKNNPEYSQNNLNVSKYIYCDEYYWVNISGAIAKKLVQNPQGLNSGDELIIKYEAGQYIKTGDQYPIITMQAKSILLHITKVELDCLKHNFPKQRNYSSKHNQVSQYANVPQKYNSPPTDRWSSQPA
ncbi:hypothetical protein [Photobacterium kishitanii]|uniref:hypothetical protein n=1 Tax=Photobacterium kishitanii TaxID=318456 RepID=UPI00273A4512|nr:hypothetical protein [Photobacterium kishitanii]